MLANGINVAALTAAERPNSLNAVIGGLSLMRLLLYEHVSVEAGIK